MYNTLCCINSFVISRVQKTSVGFSQDLIDKTIESTSGRISQKASYVVVQWILLICYHRSQFLTRECAHE